MEGDTIGRHAPVIDLVRAVQRMPILVPALVPALCALFAPASDEIMLQHFQLLAEFLITTRVH